MVAPLKNESKADWAEKEFEGAIAKIMNAAEAGEITEEEADQKIEAMRREFAGGREERGNRANEPDPRLIRYRDAEAEINKAVEAGRITREQANERLIGLRQRLWREDRDNRGEDASLSEDRARLIAEAKLAAHTEQLDPLDERTSKRLALAAKGVVEDYMESRSEDNMVIYREAETKLMQAVEDGEVTREQAEERLISLRKELWDEKGNERNTQDSGADITDHPLYQQTIKDVLSEGAFAKYKALQAEKQAFRLQADGEILSPWQQERLGEYARDFGKWFDEDDK